VKLSSTTKNTSLEVGRVLPSDVVCTIDCNYKGCRSSVVMVMRNSDVYNIIYTNQSLFPDRPARVSDDGTYRCQLSNDTQSAEEFHLSILCELIFV
jgi:hypothetical protein